MIESNGRTDVGARGICIFNTHTLADWYLTGVKEFTARHSLLDMAGAAIEAMGPRSFFHVVPLDLDMDRYCWSLTTLSGCKAFVFILLLPVILASWLLSGTLISCFTQLGFL